MKNEIKVVFTSRWKDMIGNIRLDDIVSFLSNGIIYYYGEEDTIRDLLVYMTSIMEEYFTQFEGVNSKDEYNDLALKSNFAYVFKGVPTIIYNLDVKMRSFISALNIKNELLFEPYFITMEARRRYMENRWN